MDKIEIHIRQASSVKDDVVEITNLINSVYEVAEAPIWIAGHLRTSAQEILVLLEKNELIVALSGTQLVGVIHSRNIGDTIGWFGMLAVDAELRKSGTANALLHFAENHMKQIGCDSMQCEILVPLGFKIPFKDILQSWYLRRGYRLISSTTLNKVYPEPSKDLKCPANLDMYIKELN